MAKIRVLLADDHTMFREGLRYLFARTPDIEVVGEAADGEDVLALLPDLKPDVIVMDIHMKKMNGLRTTQLLSRTPNPPAIIILTMSYQNDYLFEAIRAGAKGYYLKESDAENLISGIRQAAAGELVLDPALAQRVMQKLQQFPNASPEQGLTALSEREIDILRRVASGTSNADIATTMELSEKTIKNQLSIIFRKLGIENRTQAAIYALRHGLVTLEELEV